MADLTVVRSTAAWMALFQPSLPLPDPSNVYMEGRVLTLHEQQLPPVPSGADSNCLLSDANIHLERTPNGRLNRCLAQAQDLQPSTSSPSLQLELLEPLATGLRDMRLPQVWKAKCGNEIYVARIFDPLYVDDEGGEDVFLWIAKTMNKEAWAYHHLADLQSILIPRYKGCFLTVVNTVAQDDFFHDRPDLHRLKNVSNPAADTQEPKRRSVYVLLLEYIPGTDISHCHPSPEWPVCQTHKIAVLRALCVAWHELMLRGIRHHDFAGRNLIIKAAPVSEKPFCEDPLCKLRYQVPTTLLRNCNPETVFPVAVIDFEVYEVVEDYTRPLVTDWNEAKKGFPSLAPSWKE